MAARVRTIGAAWLLTTGLLFAFWLLLVDTTEEAQLITGLVAAAMGATGSELVRAQRIASVRPPGKAWLLRTWRPLATVPGDLLRLVRPAVLAALGREADTGRFRALPFRERGADSAEDRARQALAELAGSFSPNTIV